MDSFSHKYGESTFHFVFVTKCRYKIFSKEGHKYLCRDVLNQIAKKCRMKILALGVSDDHVHMVASLHPTMSPSSAFQLVKGTSSWVLFKAIPNFRKRYPRGSLWGKNGTFRSVSEVDVHTVVGYTERHNQRALASFLQ